MSSTWHPDDSFMEPIGGQLRGVRRVIAALKKAGIRTEGRIITSRDKGMGQLRKTLARTHMPKGFSQWQLPVVLGTRGPVLAFITVGEPGAEVPEHAHKAMLFRVIIAGSVHFRKQRLAAGDWMLVPEGVSYSLRGGEFGFIILHCYC
jgi:quercetin dioxygenase-like cupin family protein